MGNVIVKTVIDCVDLFTTMECNLNCLYCFHEQRSELLTPDKAVSYLEKLKPKMSERCLINFFGGEPLLNFETIEAVVLYAKRNNLNYSFSLSTNGTVYDEKIFNFLKENDFQVQVSMDGDKETQDAYRGGYDVIKDNIKKIISHGIIPACRLTFNKDTVSSLASNVAHLHSVIGFKSVMHQAVISNSWSDQDIQIYKNQIMTLDEFYLLNPDFKNKFLDYSRICACATESTCTAGKSLIAITPDGTVYPCHRFASNKQYKLGSVESFHCGIFTETRRSNMGNCATCKAAATCHTCMAAHYETNHSISEPVDAYCKLLITEHESLVEMKKASDIRLEQMLKMLDELEKGTCI